MKYLASTLFIVILLSCVSNENEDKIENDLTGNEVTYTLFQGSDYNISGEVTIQETINKSSWVKIKLIGTQSGLIHPTHLHFDDIAGDGDIAAVLNPVDGSDGVSETLLEFFTDSTPVTYNELLQMESSIKVHLSETEPGKHTILAGGNIGTADFKSNPFGRVEISVCKSN